MENDKVLVCPVCQYKNKSGALQCVRCGVSLSAGSTTVNVPDAGVATPADTHLQVVHRHGLLNQGLVLYVAGELRPLIVRGRREIVLGRRAEDAPATVVDLTQFRGHLMGVSRRHASIKLTDDGYLLEDLNSTNGTWLNERRLVANSAYVINNGDQVRLGQLVLYVYFSSPSTKQVISLRDLSSGEPPDMEKQVKPFLESLVVFQETVDKWLGQSGHPTVHDTVVNPATSLVDARLEDLMDAVQLVRDTVQTWKQENSATISILRIAEQIENSEVAIDTAMNQAFDDAVSKLAVRILHLVKPELAQSEVVSHAQESLAVLKKLAFSPLEITDGVV